MRRLNIEDIDFENRELTVFGKGEKWRTTYMSAAAVVSIKMYLQERTDNNPALFVSKREPHERLTTFGIRKILHKLSEEAGVPDVIPHKFRHTFATAAVNRGMPLESLQQTLGHENVETTMHYAHINKEKVKADHRRYIGK